MKNEVKATVKEARETLKALSQEVSDLVEAGTFCTINDAIMETLYKNNVHREFKSYRQWRKDGFQVRKGEKAFLLWARPKDIERTKEEETTTSETEKNKFFPIAYLFSNAQVDPIHQDESPPVQEPITAELEPLPYV